MPKSKERRSLCPISTSLEVWGDKWSLLILRDLLYFKKSSFKDFLESPEKIATNILTDRLQTLEQEGLIKKVLQPGSKMRVQYRLTQKGIDLLPLMMEITLWADKYYEIAETAKERARKARADKEALLQSLRSELEKEL